MTEFAQDLRHYCRNPHCRMKLKAPADIAKAFCTPGCRSSYYRHRCVICEQPMERKTEHQRICGKRRCRNALQGSSNRKGHQAPSRVFGPIKTPIKPGIKRADFDDRPWYIVAGPKTSACVYHCAALTVDPETARRIDAANDWDRIRKESAWSKPRLTAPKELQSDWRPCAPSVPFADDLSIPDFLKGEPVAVSESPEDLLVDALPADQRHNGAAP